MLYVLAILIVLIVIYIAFILPTQWLKIEHVRYSSELGIRMLQISDIHAEKARITPAKLRRVIDQLKPDYIVVTGDFTQKAKHLPKVKRYAEAIGGAGIPTYAVLGNHDHRLDRNNVQRLVDLLDTSGIQVLQNKSVLIDSKFRLVGIDDYGSKKSKFKAAYQKVEPRMPVIVLTHDPNAVLELPYAYHYLVAGHFHGMQFHIPFLFRFINKGKLAAAGIYKGLHRSKQGAYYISKGIGQAGPNARFLVRSEVTLHEL